MLANIPQGKSTQHSIHQCVKGNVSIAVPQQPQRMGDVYAAQDQIPSFCQAMYIKAVTDSKIRNGFFQERCSHFHVLRRGQFDVALVSLHKLHRMSHMFEQGCIVCASIIVLQGLLMGFYEQAGQESLRCLHCPQRGSRWRRKHIGICIDNLHRIRCRNGGYASAALLHRGHHTPDSCAVHQASCTVMNKHTVACLRQCL